MRFLFTFLAIIQCNVVFSQSIREVKDVFDSFLLEAKNGNYNFKPDSTAYLDTLYINKKNHKLTFFLSKQWEYSPIRKETISELNSVLRGKLGKTFQKYDLEFYVGTSKDKVLQKEARKKKWPITPKYKLESLIPNYYLYAHEEINDKKLKKDTAPQKIHVRRVDTQNPKYLTQGLYGNHLAIWNSHGWYYEQSLDRWEWQRARLFQTVEDLLPTSIVLPYLAPMLENAGANVYIPRERDIQKDLLVIDNDGERNGYYEKEGVVAGPSGFLNKKFYNQSENPFLLGTSRKIKASHKESIAFSWKTEGRINGKFAVYISYKKLDEQAEDAKYIIHHKKQKTTFIVNQSMGYGTWVYLGTFEFDGSDGEGVYLSQKSSKSGVYISADAVRFGGGVGNIVRGEKSSGRPRYMEAATYNLQYSGVPEHVYSPNEGENDYKDDYQSRGEWVNWMNGNKFALNPDVENEGINLPIDLAIALHTDAGISESDTTIGTLMIYSTTNMKKQEVFPNGQSRLSNRDLADIIQTEIIKDIRTLHDSTWNRREMWDKRYSEAVYPEVPTVLIELLSHQNFKDMWYGLDPSFRFDVARSIYKGILKYQASQENRKFTVQPLAPGSFFSSLKNGKAYLSWVPTVDKLEESAEAKYYKLYTNINNQGWDNGRIVKTNEISIPITKGDFYSFKITALNEGGESFPSEILCLSDFGNSPVLIVNAFDRTGPPSKVISNQYAGFTNQDNGVADKVNLSFTGQQYDFNPKSPWLDDDAPGFGGSYGNKEGKVVMGNTFDYPEIHGQSLYYLKRSFISCNKNALESRKVKMNDYEIVDIIFGEQRSYHQNKKRGKKEFILFSEALKAEIKNYLNKGGKLFLSGAYIGSELFYQEDGTPKGRKHPDVLFAKNTLHFIGRTDQADVVGDVFSVNKQFSEFNNTKYSKSYNNNVYVVESPDAIEPSGDNTSQICRYTSNNKGAGVMYNGEKSKIIITGFPFETILSEDKRILLMEQFLDFFTE